MKKILSCLLVLLLLTGICSYTAMGEQVTLVQSVAAAPTLRPIFSKSEGTYDQSVTVKISSKAGAKIYYTTDGSTPTVKSKQYTSAIKLTKTTTLQAIAVLGKSKSTVASSVYTVQVTKPVFSVEAGYYTKNQTITITGMDSKTTIYYTTDGSTPTTKSKKYTSPIKVKKYTKIRARAYKSGCLKSAIVTQEYNIDTSSTTIATANDTVEKTFTWSDGSMDWTTTVSISKTDYEYYYKKVNLDQYNGYDYAAYATDTSDDAWIAEFTDSIVQAGKAQGYTDKQIVMLLVTFVQNITYTSDLESTGQEEFPKYPIVTLYDQEGDCEDSAVLLASMLKAAGYDCVLLEYTDHMAVGIAGSYSGVAYSYHGTRYFYIETTSVGWSIGELPSGVYGAIIYPI
jgi:predicted transglutaminase-like cysteine proteinase